MKGLLAWALVATALAWLPDQGRAAPAAQGAAKRAAPQPPASSPLATWTEPLTQMVFVAVPKGCFDMGSKAPRSPSGQVWTEVGYRGDLAANERPQHQVCLDAYWIARHEVRRGDWRRLMPPGEPPQADDSLPQGGVSWAEAVRFAARLSAQSAGGEAFRLPTEAEWERACRAGQDDAPDAETVFRRAWFGAPYRAPVAAAPAASLAPNFWGIFDLLGNHWEWVADGYSADAYARHTLYNPRHEAASDRVIRGGSYRSELAKLRCTARGHYSPAETLPQIGFRLVMTRPAAPGKAAK